jgi:hypothetical protein
MALYHLKGPIGIMATIIEALASVDIPQPDTGSYMEILEIASPATVRGFTNNGHGHEK